MDVSNRPVKDLWLIGQCPRLTNGWSGFDIEEGVTQALVSGRHLALQVPIPWPPRVFYAFHPFFVVVYIFEMIKELIKQRIALLSLFIFVCVHAQVCVCVCRRDTRTYIYLYY